MQTDHLPLSKVVALVLGKLDNPGWPRDGITQHHGVSVGWRGFTVSVSDGHESDGKQVLVTCYDQTGVNGHPKRTHDKHCRAIALGARAKVVDRWNGEEGNGGVSVRLDRRVPESLHIAMSNYRALENPFKLTKRQEAQFRAFDRWWERVST